MLRRLFSYMGRYKKYAYLALFCIAVESIFELLVPLIMADLVDVGVASGDRAYIFQKGAEMVLCGVLALVLGIGSARFSALAGQGPWTPWQMYAWGLVGYVGGLLGEKNLLSRPVVLYGWGLASGPVYGLILNGYHVLGYVQPLTWPAVLAACAASLPLDVVHGVATVAFLAAIWLPWGHAIRRVVAKYDL